MRPAKRGSRTQADPSPGAPPGFVTSRCEKRGPKGALRERSRFQVPGFRFRICDLVLARFVPARGIRCQPQELSCVRRDLGAHSGPVPNQSTGKGIFWPINSIRRTSKSSQRLGLLKLIWSIFPARVSKSMHSRGSSWNRSYPRSITTCVDSAKSSKSPRRSRPIKLFPRTLRYSIR